MKQSKKIWIFLFLLAGMLYFIGWIFYISEPVYMNNSYKKPEKYDMISMPEYSFIQSDKSVITGIVIQVDSAKILVKAKSFLFNEKFYDLDINDKNYRVVGKGTIYHKVNDYVGFNIMLFAQVCIGVVFVILCSSFLGLLSNILKSDG
jgi:hypothetical protein